MTAKRAFDLVASTLGLIIASPVLVVIAIAIKLTSRGPVLHRAVRIGKEERPFTVLKFRTMRPDDGRGPGITSSRDPRITSVGRFLRRSKLDELPQLVNVVRDEMSLVGPRPEDPRYVASYTDEQRRVLSVLPGLTSPASLAYRDEEELIASHGDDVESVYRERILPAKLAIDLDYIDRQSFLVDLSVLLRTALGVLARPKRSR